MRSLHVVRGTVQHGGADYAGKVNIGYVSALFQSLESLGIQQLYTTGGDRRVQLKRLLHSVVMAFLDLIEILVRAPESPERQKKLEDIRIVFINMHHLINEYRPVQARETVQLMLELQVRILFIYLINLLIIVL